MIHEHWVDVVEQKLGPKYRVGRCGHIYDAQPYDAYWRADKELGWWQRNPHDYSEIGRAFKDGRIEVYNRGFAEYCDKQGFRDVYLVPEGTWGRFDW
jgi:hypothetical protein